MSGAMSIRQPTIFLDGLVPAAAGHERARRRRTPRPADWSSRSSWSGRLQPFLAEVAGEREHQNETIRRHVEISLRHADRPPEPATGRLPEPPDRGAERPRPRGLISQAEAHLDRLNERLEQRLRELEMERHCTIADITHLGRAWVLPHPERTTPGMAPMVRDEEIERIAVEFVDPARGGTGLAGRERRDREPGLRPDLPPASPRGPQDVRRGPVHRGQGPGRRRRDRPDRQRVQDRRAAQGRLLALRGLQLRDERRSCTRSRTRPRLGWVPVVQVEHYQIDPGKILAVKGERGGEHEGGLVLEVPAIVHRDQEV